ncbi:hypothetical protein GLYMA_20G003951v4 [Glycine max]|nr:hypothetical protein GLYMA_20G003951v4 [Glycine max]KAH1033904.1 hypothetical protein GYH30_054354 [Glycine max]
MKVCLKLIKLVSLLELGRTPQFTEYNTHTAEL